MTIRQRQAPGSMAAPVANGADTHAARGTHFSWEDWFRHASPQQRADALGLAQQQGVLYPHQLPAVSNGVKPAAVLKETAAAQTIARLLAGKAESLPRLGIDDFSFFDTDLDDLQRHAVARALATPDVLLLQGLPGTGKSRVLTEIILQAARRGWRVLFLAGHTASLDVILQRLVGRSEILALRFLDGPEKPESLPAWLRGFTLEAQRREFVERVLAGARGNHAQADAACRQYRDQEPLWAELATCAERCRELEHRLQTLNADGDCAAPTAGVASPFMIRLAEVRQAHDREMSAIADSLRTQQEALAKCEREVAEVAARIAEREPAFLAKKHSRWWTLSYWLNLFNGQIVQEMESLLDQHARATSARREIVQQIDQINERQHRCQDQFENERAALLAGEQEACKESARQEDSRWTDLCRQLGAAPDARTPEAIASAHQAWQQRQKLDEQRCQFAQQWTRFLEETGPALAVKLPSFANVLAGTILRWHTDAAFRDAFAEPADLLIVEDAETLTEADLLKLSRHARRCVLVGQALAEPAPAPTAAEKASRALLPTPLVSAVCWSKLWQALGGEAGRWPCAWHRREGRLVCQLFPLAAEDVQHLESECLADAPDIELRILHRPGGRPCLAQVAFGPPWSFADAFRFMMREVQEFPLEPLGRTGWWTENAQRHCRHFGAGLPRIETWIDLEPGVRLGSLSDETRVACIEFDKSAGWDRARAEAWLQRHRSVADQERTVFLQTPYRFEPALAHLVRAVVRASDWSAGDMGRGDRSAFDFVAVPAVTKHEWPRDGAGLEVDLSGSRFADRLPVGVRQGLPARGFVNYLEAQALIRRLEAWQPEAPDWRVAVLALFEGQVELLRRLVEQSEVLRSCKFPMEVALASKLHQRECDVVFLSLTRSHAHRSVAFSEDAKELPLALTRPRRGLFVFGDPGSLMKRVSWHGPIEHLDAHSAQQEHFGLSRLLAYLQSHGHVVPTANGLSHVK